jgi:hypothetical protein
MVIWYAPNTTQKYRHFYKKVATSVFYFHDSQWPDDFLQKPSQRRAARTLTGVYSTKQPLDAARELSTTQTLRKHYEPVELGGILNHLVILILRLIFG